MGRKDSAVLTLPVAAPDRLFGLEVEPALQRVKNYGAVTAAACVASFLLFRLASPDSP